MTVLDSSAVLAYLNAESGHERVVGHLEDGVVSSVNWTEICQKVAEYTGSTRIADGLLALGLTVMPFSRADAVRAARLYPHTRSAGLSLGDRACIAVAIGLDRPVVTADRVWRELFPQLEVEVIR